MSMSYESKYADWTLRLLLEPDRGHYSSLNELGDVRWDVFLGLARKNVVLIRSYNRLEKLRVIPDAAFREAEIEEEKRIRCTVELIERISEICAQGGIAFVFTKAFQHYPDMGHDVDLFVLDRSKRADTLIAETLGVSPAKGSLLNWISGKEGYYIEGYPSPVEIHHGRMGHIGEHNAYPDILMKNRTSISIGGITTFVPCPEDQLVIQVMQRIYDYRYIRLSDVVHTLTTIREDTLDWDYVVRTTNQIGIFDGLCCYLSYMDQIHDSLFEKPLLSPEVRKMLILDGWGKVQFRGGHYRFPNVSVMRVYSKKFLAEVLSGNWEAVGRLCLLPPVAVLVGVRSLARWGLGWDLKPLLRRGLIR